jgi:hypothetical protein
MSNAMHNLKVWPECACGVNQTQRLISSRTRLHWQLLRSCWIRLAKVGLAKIALPKIALPKIALPKIALGKKCVAKVKRLYRIAGPEIAGNINRGCLPLAGRPILQFVVDFENARVKKSFPEPATVVV